jgi:transposase
VPTLAARAAFGQADGYIAGKKVRLHYFCVYLTHTDGCFVKAYPAGTAEAFRDGHVAAFDFSGDNSLAGKVRLC